ncbi:MAG: dihydrofolate reductase family protein [Actinomycetota bacterium]|nr:dihydrofolate reductase family protein [Actinomycetota bacterium]
MRLLHPHGPDPDADVDRDALVGLYAHPGGRTWTRLSFVATADGSTQGGDRRAGSLSTPADREVFALLRSLSDVILVGAGTARAEAYEPVRPQEVDTGLRRRLRLAPVPVLAVVSARLDLPDRLLDAGEGSPRTIVVTTADAPADRRERIAARAEVVVAGDRTLDLGVVTRSLADRGLTRVLAEGGPSLAGALAAHGHLDELCLTLRAQLVAGAGVRVMHGDPLDPGLDLDLGHVLVDGADLFCRWTTAGPTTTERS